MLLFAQVLLGPIAAGQDCVEWMPRTPMALTGHCMAYDEARGVTVLFGGLPGNTSFDHPIGETWEWDGRHWTYRTSTGPSPRSLAAMAYDSDRHVIVLFGGGGPSGTLSDTWEWDGQSWTGRDTSPPPQSPAREYPALAYDPVRHVMVLAGGAGSQAQAGTWEWDGSAWTRRTTRGPSFYGPMMFYDGVRNQMICFDGTAEDGSTWAYDGNAGAWSLLEVKGPSSRYDAAMALDRRSGVAVLFGGFRSDPFLEFGDTWEWQSAIGQWVQSTEGSLPARNASCMAGNAQPGEVVLYSGQGTGHLYSDTWRYDTASHTWAKAAEGPIAHYYSAFTYDPVRQGCVLLSYVRPYLSPGQSELLLWSGDRWESLAVGGPPIRRNPRMVFDSLRNRLVLFTGVGPPSSPENQTWEWDGTSWTRMFVPGPTTREYTSMAFDPVRGVTVLFGGAPNSASVLDDTWEWNGRTWTHVASGGPPARGRAVFAFDPTRGKCVLFGGFPASGLAFQDTWTWDGTTWMQEPFLVTWIPVRAGVMVFDENIGACSYFPEAPGNGLNTVSLQLTPTGWTERHLPGKNVNGSPIYAAFDAHRGRMMIIGGPFEIYNRLYELTPNPLMCPGDTDHDGVIGVADLLAVIQNWHVWCTSQPCPGDANFDNGVDEDDILFIIAHWHDRRN